MKRKLEEEQEQEEEEQSEKEVKKEESEGEESEESEQEESEEKRTEKWTIIPSGYRITINSWERDLDFDDEVIVQGYTKEETQFIIQFLKLFQRSSKFSNLYDPSTKIVNELYKIVSNLIITHQPYSYKLVGLSIPDDVELLKTSVENDNYDEMYDIFREFFSDYLGHGDPQFPRFTRVCSSIKVEYIPEEIRMLDVSKEFGITDRFSY